MLLELLFGAYLFNSIIFSISSSCIIYCLLLVLNAMLSGLICYVIYGYSWYTLLFCLIYIGGVYISFIFVSVFSPNSSYVANLNIWLCGVGLLFVVILGLMGYYSLVSVEFSEYLCTSSEISMYICFGFTLMFGLLVLSLVFSCKLNFYR
uniref:NADH dehydrogenase subunit 6 n=1 Tax=Hydatigera parva TaxID=1434711 RepID=N0DMK6_9CEST|nr:NADH dehydrogenase subunit 6 [Hydatigera parva]BAN15664.1 NADH dehydrogenase subunit 6 [Hydatigera parva]